MNRKVIINLSIITLVLVFIFTGCSGKTEDPTATATINAKDDIISTDVVISSNDTKTPVEGEKSDKLTLNYFIPNQSKCYIYNESFTGSKGIIYTKYTNSDNKIDIFKYFALSEESSEKVLKADDKVIKAISDNVVSELNKYQSSKSTMLVDEKGVYQTVFSNSALEDTAGKTTTKEGKNYVFLFLSPGEKATYSFKEESKTEDANTSIVTIDYEYTRQEQITIMEKSYDAAKIITNIKLKYSAEDIKAGADPTTYTHTYECWYVKDIGLVKKAYVNSNGQKITDEITQLTQIK